MTESDSLRRMLDNISVLIRDLVAEQTRHDGQVAYSEIVATFEAAKTRARRTELDAGDRRDWDLSVEAGAEVEHCEYALSVLRRLVEVRNAQP